MMDDTQSPALFAPSADFAMNAIEPERTADADISRRRPSDHVPVQQFGYLAVLARRRSEFDAARALLREQAGGSPFEAARDDTGTDGVPNTGAINSVPKFTQITDAPERVRRSYLRAGGQYFLKDAPYPLAFEDRGRYLVTTHTRTDIVASMMDLVQAKAWTHIRVSGHDAFCREVWRQGASIGIEVSGYTPNPADLARLSELNAPTEHTRDRDAERPVLQPQAATIATPRGARDESPDRPVGASVRHSRSLDDGIQLAVIVAAMREQGFSDRSVDRVKRRAVRMLDALHAEGVELPRPRVFDPAAPSARAERGEHRRSSAPSREINHAPAMQLPGER
ncbi:TPA: LPD7 domain-containing protein [Burkholderia orbicola]|uniref:LPD7 domain-containing protein n=1 Tax=Burkholderia cepacia complex TaxID=87882 RepID=UPI001639E86C|nr:LPD7 domain-containing protein [Burkholderia cenocepacia]